MADGYRWGLTTGRGRLHHHLMIDLSRAFALAGFGRYESILIELAKERSWLEARLRKASDPLPFTLDVAGIARSMLPPDAPEGRYRTLKRRLFEARSDLVKMRVFVESPGGLTLNKSADSWTKTDGVSPLIDPDELLWARGFERQRECGKPHREECGIPHQNEGGIPHECGKAPSGVRNSASLSAEFRTKTPSPPDPQLGPRTREDPTGYKDPTGFKDPPNPPEVRDSPEPSPPAMRPGRGDTDGSDPARDGKALEAFAEALRPLEGGGGRVATWIASGLPRPWIRDALLVAQAAGKSGREFWTYTNGTLSRWRQAGAPEFDRVQWARELLDRDGQSIPIRPKTPTQAREEKFRAEAFERARLIRVRAGLEPGRPGDPPFDPEIARQVQA